MAVKPQSLSTPERDLRLATREVADDDQPVSEEVSAAEELRALKARIDAARSLRPKGHELHCGDCFKNGRDAAIRLIEGSKKSR